jgi:hypothetical protein
VSDDFKKALENNLAFQNAFPGKNLPITVGRIKAARHDGSPPKKRDDSSSSNGNKSGKPWTNNAKNAAAGSRFKPKPPEEDRSIVGTPFQNVGLQQV